jgi:hypothetical protein
MTETIVPRLEEASLQTRSEHSRSIEDAEKYRAIETLKEVGLLVPVCDLETFHGRVGNAGEVTDWVVDPSFANGGNDSGNSNVNNRPTLYTSDKKIAQDFADERAGFSSAYLAYLRRKVENYTPEENVGRLERQNAWLKKLWEERVADGRADAKTPSPAVWTMDELLAHGSFVEAQYLKEHLGEEAYSDFKKQYKDKIRTEVHEIVTADTDASVIDYSFDETKLDDEAQKRYKEALKALAIPITEGSPVSFNDRDTVELFIAALLRANKRILSSSDIAELAADANVDERIVLQLASAYNSRVIALSHPVRLVRDLLNSTTDIFVDNLVVNDEQMEIPVNLEYTQRYLREAHIVGVKQQVYSATIHRNITSVSFLDLEKTITKKGLEVERKDTWQRLGSIATALGQFDKTEVSPRQPLLHLLTDAHAKPDKLVAAAKKTEGYDVIFDEDVGNWEGFTLAEYTETVLRNFDESFAEILPVELLASMRLAILAHALGKPIAASLNEKHKTKEYNVAQANDFLGKLGVDDRLKSLLLAVIGEGEELAFQIEIKEAGESAATAMREVAIKTLKQFYDSETVTEEQITGFIEMCKMLQVCDGGAYTSMAITRKNGAKGRYRNAPSFNDSFARPLGFGKRTIRLRENGNKSADRDLTPKNIEKRRV